MKVPLLGPVSLTGFQNPWFFLALLAVLLVIGLYVVQQFARRRRVLRFANMEVLERVAPPHPSRWRHVPTILLAAALVLLTTAMAGPTSDVRIPLNRAVVMLVIDVSESMASNDVPPNRLAAAKEAGKQFADQLTPAINLGLVEFAANATLLVPPTTNRSAVKSGIDGLQPAPKTATGEGIFTALQAIATVGSVMGGGEGPPPARIVLESDGAENVPLDPNAPQGAFTAARAAKGQGVQISTISFGTPYGTVDYEGATIPVPVDDQTLQKICEITDGEAFHADSLDSLKNVYTTLQRQIGYETVEGDASLTWMLLGAVVMAGAVLAGLLLNRRLPA
ncbi:VWA domain-containing protein [Mycobacterium marseillense]|uniref:VWA domain-containing protein n=1 Tax=Mycobacterium marseillense TaxID=701042 RepID=UPI00119E7E29|nr:VWA domain-containing protein [Mycobacterium marseillense]MDM3977274.1 VWA domain-containing protein [Mycobacterium marseillense]